MAHSNETVTARAAGAAHEAVDKAARAAERVEERTRQTADDVRERAKCAADEAQRRSGELGDTITDYVHDHPFRSLGIAFITGIVISNFLRR